MEKDCRVIFRLRGIASVAAQRTDLSPEELSTIFFPTSLLDQEDMVVGKERYKVLCPHCAALSSAADHTVSLMTSRRHARPVLEVLVRSSIWKSIVRALSRFRIR
jgi:hypothetical protein